MKKIKVISLIASIVAILGVGGYYAMPDEAQANPSHYQGRVATASATSSPDYITPGTGTTTLTYDAFSTGTNHKLDAALLNVQFTASSTGSILRWRYEFSRDNVDWYSEDTVICEAVTTQACLEAGGQLDGVTATSTHVTDFRSHSWTFASSTAASSNDDTSFRMLEMPTPLRYTRVVFFIDANSDNLAVWAEIVPVKENSED